MKNIQRRVQAFKRGHGFRKTLNARRPFVPMILCCLFAFSTLADRKPNVLWIMADDHAAYVTGCYGNPIVRTPNIDRLASQGIRFDRAYCNSPICTASRQSFLTGRYPRTIGVTDLRTPLPEREVTLAEYLKGAGYATAAFGKMHFNSDLKHGFDERLDFQNYFQALRQRGGKKEPAGVELYPQWKPFRDPARIWLNGIYKPYAVADDMMGTFFADAAVEFLERKHDKPFFMIASFPEPHSPFHFPAEFSGRYDPSQMPVERVGPEDDDQIPDIFRGLTPREKQGIVASYYTSTEWTDANVGRVLDALERGGHADDTLVIYIGDHGYSLGQHGRFEKHCMYEPAIRSPLIVRYPGRVKPGRDTAALVEFIDIVPTVLEACGVEVPPDVQGKSLLPILAGTTDRHREHLFIEYSHNEEAMVSDGRWKLVFIRGKRKRDDGYDENRPLKGNTLRLFDLASDPGEFRNLAYKPKYAARVNAMRKLLVDHMKRTARQPQLIPDTDDPMEILDFCVQPRDLVAAK